MHSPLLVIGADSSLGNALLQSAKKSAIPAVGTSRRDHEQHILYKLEQPPHTLEIPNGTERVYICSAVTNLKSCEDDPDGSYFINVACTQALLKMLLEKGLHVIYLSSDCVAHSGSNYALQKLEIERYLRGKSATCCRLGKILTNRNELFLGWLNALASGQTIEAFSNYFLSPTSREFCIEQLLRIGPTLAPKLVSIAGLPRISYFDAICHIARKRGLNLELIQPATKDDISERLVEVYPVDEEWREDSLAVLDRLFAFPGTIPMNEE